MRKIINSTYITLDAAVENPHLWPSLKGAEAESYRIQDELLQACDAMLMGRRTYDSFAAVWPTRRGDRVSDRINSLQKYAVSNSLVGPTWNNTTVIGGDVVRTIRQLKEQPGKDIVQYGLGDVSFLLMDHGLIDEIRLWVHPIILGRSGPSAPHFGRCPASRLRLTASNVLPNGIAILNYDVDQPK